MPLHEFGIVDTTPLQDDSFLNYEPEKYNCVTVDDDILWTLLPACEVLETFLHSLLKPAKGLNYWGITLIPPSSLPQFRKIVEGADKSELQALSAEIGEAIRQQKFMIHFGI